ncbi:WhiB family transcriptional regulator [Streptosporangium lutulentum]|uniref:4Fe-4S Wbl-type domain-containing protein n=1 Tax=Streptosporangium lutulentum TaxID=1461250 RepID=A0ABT9QAA5_9ACTN|nr:WhiB family transcriptional regulator [Streptosporangium lutulentum]MDP9843306.1 hypothetical protein [Streptosporangium lutulentum]
MTLPNVIGPIPAWHWDAACGNLGKLFGSKEPEDIAQQKKVCAACPVLAKCSEHAKATRKNQLPDLVVAGLTREERRSSPVDGGLVDEPRECLECGDEKPLEQFVKKTSMTGGRSRVCKTCTNKLARAAYAARKAAAQ